MKKRFRVFTTAVTPVGTFKGYASVDKPTVEEAATLRDEIQQLLRQCDMLTLFQEDGTEITLTEQVNNHSAFIFEIQEHE